MADPCRIRQLPHASSARVERGWSTRPRRVPWRARARPSRPARVASMGRPDRLRRLAHGLLAGALLSCLRAPLGLDWTQLAVVQGTTAGLFRAAALLAIALSLDPARPALRAGAGAGWLAAVFAGYAG